MTATVNHTIQNADQTGGIEVPVGDSVSATVVDGETETEFMVGRYSIDIDASTIAMRFNDATAPVSTTPPGSFDRYYITLDLATNESIAQVFADDSSIVSPNIGLQQNNVLVVEIGPGTSVGGGQDILLNVQVTRSGTVVTGRKFHDANSDSQFNRGESWLNGWQVNLIDINQNSTVIATTTTRDLDLNLDGRIDPRSERGVYEFTDIPAGTYLVQEVQQPGWDATLPASPETVAAYNLDQNVDLRAAGRSFLNWGGLQEKWLFGSGSWYFITPNGTVSQWNGSPSTNLTGTVVAELNSDYYDDLTRLTNAESPRQYIVDIDVSSNQTYRGLHFGNFLAPPDFTVVENADNTVTLQWASSVANTYDVWITDINTGRRFEVTEGIAGSGDTSVSSYTSGLLPDRRYRVWMRTQANEETYSPWSASQEFEFTRDTAAPSITAGLDAGIDATPTLTIAPQSDAVSYDLRVSNANGIVIYNGNGSATQRITRRLSAGTYTVAARANYADGSRTAFSAGQTLTVGGRPTVAVAGNQIAWTPINGATEYDLWIDRVDNDGTRIDSQVVRLESLRRTSFIPSLRTGEYTVWVRAIRSEDGARYPSFWSSQVFFSVDSSGNIIPNGQTAGRLATSGGSVIQQASAFSAVTDVMAEIAVSGILAHTQE